MAIFQYWLSAIGSFYNKELYQQALANKKRYRYGYLTTLTLTAGFIFSALATQQFLIDVRSFFAPEHISHYVRQIPSFTYSHDQWLLDGGQESFSIKSKNQHTLFVYQKNITPTQAIRRLAQSDVGLVASKSFLAIHPHFFDNRRLAFAFTVKPSQKLNPKDIQEQVEFIKLAHIVAFVSKRLADTTLAQLWPQQSHADKASSINFRYQQDTQQDLLLKSAENISNRIQKQWLTLFFITFLVKAIDFFFFSIIGALGICLLGYLMQLSIQKKLTFSQWYGVAILLQTPYFMFRFIDQMLEVYHLHQVSLIGYFLSALSFAVCLLILYRVHQLLLQRASQDS